MKAAIDIGTNTVLLLVAEIENGTVKPVYEEQHMPRLGKGVDAEHNIGPKAEKRVIEALKACQQTLKTKYSQINKVTVTATSAVRDANNRAAFIAAVKRETGFSIRLLNGAEEAECTAVGALSVLPDRNLPEVLILDIGGGSTEVAQVKNTNVTDVHSFDMGAVRFTERFMSGNPPTEKEILACRKAVSELYNSRPFEFSGQPFTALGVAGTLTTLAGMALKLKSYEPDKINGYELQIETVRYFIQEFSIHSQEEMLGRHPVYLKGREDIFMAGLLILEGFMEHFEIESLKISTGGIRHGALLTLA